MMATVPFHRLECLSNDDSWSLFKRRAFGMGTNEGNPNLETIGSKIEQRCGGVPLAIKATGSILCFKSLESEWLHVRDSEIWDLEDEASRILAVLRLSYEHLPSYMRQCFSFCSIFPKDYVMNKDELIGLWMAPGFIPSHHWICTIQGVKYSLKRYEICVIDSNKRLKLPKTDRLLFIHTSNSPTNIVDLSKLQPLRSLILDRDLVFRSASNISNQKYLKVLDFGRRLSNIAFKSLKQLRYFCLHDHRVKTLPESTNSLHNLQTLNLERCRSLKMLPKGMKYLKNQRYLDLRGCDDLISMPVGLGQLSCLRKLSKFIAGKDKGCGIDELNELAIEGELSITGLCNVKNSKEAENANLIKKQNLRSLSLTWQNRESTHHQHINDEKVLNALQPRSSLKKLCITGYQGVRFPNWMNDLLLPNLVEISLEDCERCD
ncbi:putative disease resistance protein RGA1 [Hibiscus syriacus]|uniref:putative disease resistance protein RGA1 n=1 Tax=Hibiscus syriacus TaxID=106335 RepID=UPI0019248BCE|nr:putative disease resistance protein RGA1 [Hibiscus syriacus]